MKTPITEISGYPYPDRISFFRANCRNYNIYQDWLRMMERSMHQQKNDQEEIYDCVCGTYRTSQESMERYEILKNNVAAVEETLDKVRCRYGRLAEDMVREAYVSGIKRKEIAHKYHLSENELQRSYHTWLSSVIYEEDGKEE
jgi:hypothetical protein